MALQAHHTDHDHIGAAFLSNKRGEVCIVFSDPVYARADGILLERESRALHIILHGRDMLVGHLSDSMAGAFAASGEALLTAVRADGSLLELTAPVQVTKS